MYSLAGKSKVSNAATLSRIQSDFLIIVQQDFSIMVCDWNKPLFEYSGDPNIGLLNNRYKQQTFAIRYLNGLTNFLVQINFCHSNSGLVRDSVNFDSKGWLHKLVPLMFNFFQRIFVINLFYRPLQTYRTNSTMCVR